MITLSKSAKLGDKLDKARVAVADSEGWVDPNEALERIRTALYLQQDVLYELLEDASGR